MAEKKKEWLHFWECQRYGDKREETRNELLLAAFSEIHRVGFQAASLQNILKHTGVTKGALYHHFPNKLELGYAVLDEVIGVIMRNQWIEPLQSTDKPVETLTQILMDGKELFTDEDIRLGCPLNNLAQEMTAVDDGFRQRINAVYTEWRETIENALRRGVNAGNVRKDVVPEQAATMIVATLEGCIGMAKTAQSMQALEQCGGGLLHYLETLKEQGKNNE